MIEVENLTKLYGDRAAISGVSFRVEKGEIMGFLGPNGAGKTTTMRILAGVMGPTEGSATVAGFDITDAPRDAKRRTGYLPEHPPVYRDMTVDRYVDYAARLHGVSRGERGGRVDAALSKMHLTDVRARLIGHLSKGYQQRVGIAQALVHDPEVLILDEPTVGLDPTQIKEIRTLIRGLAGHHTILLSTHILPEVEMTCQKVVVIHKGQVVKEATIDSLRREREGQGSVLIELARPGEGIAAALQAVSGVTRVDAGPTNTTFALRVQGDIDPREAISKLIVDNGWGLLEIKNQPASLEDIFVQLTTDEQGVEA